MEVSWANRCAAVPGGAVVALSGQRWKVATGPNGQPNRRSTSFALVLVERATGIEPA